VKAPLKRRLWLATPAFLFFFAAFDYKTPKDFKTLENFKSVEAFEASYAEYVQDCFDNTGGGTGGIRCTQLEYELWDREMNIYYKRLLAKVSDPTALKESQRLWIQMRDKTIEVNSALLDRRYQEQGTMYALMRAGDAARIITPLVKQRALMLRDMVVLLNEAP